MKNKDKELALPLTRVNKTHSFPFARNKVCDIATRSQVVRCLYYILHNIIHDLFILFMTP